MNFINSSFLILCVVHFVANLKISHHIYNLRTLLLGTHFCELFYVIGISFGQANILIIIYVK